MSELHLPSDYERLRPFRRLVVLLQERRVTTLTSQTPNDPSTHNLDEVMCEMAASFLWNRLWCELALLARSTNRPGWLPQEDRRSYEKTVEPIFGDDCKPVELLVQCGLLLVLPDGWICELFARLNPHTSGDYQTKEERGAHRSAVVRNAQNVAKEAQAQSYLLPPETFKKRDGSRMNDTEIQRAMNCIKSLDNSLKLSGRSAGQYTEGLMADAADVIERFTNEELTDVYVWVRMNRDHPASPRSTEAVLKEFDRYEELAGKN